MEEIELLMKLGEYQYMKKLIKDGELYLRPISDFAKMDSAYGIGDKYENMTSSLCPKDPSIKIISKDGTELSLSKNARITYGEHSLTDYLIYSMSMVKFIKNGDILTLKHPDTLNKTGSCYDTIVIIFNPQEFIRRIERAMNNNWGMECKAVNYYPEKDIILKKLTLFDKRECYSHQNEFRFCFDCDINKPFSLQIGNIEDIAQIKQAISKKQYGNI